MRLASTIIVCAFIGLGLALVLYLPNLNTRFGVMSNASVEGIAAEVSQGLSTTQVRDVESEIAASRRSAVVVAAERVSPAVVSITVIQTRVVTRSPAAFFNDPFFDQFFREFFGARRYVERVPSLGSGFIVTPDGLVVTNEHVIRDASEIKVTLPDSREFDAEILASDPEYDLALLKINGKNLPYVELGDSDSLIIGEWAIAIGNPFGYLLEDAHPSVTVGVISALHRSIKTGGDIPAVYADMIQTDAAINPGNSGGPLVNALGQVVGVNTFIISKSGGSMGIGFAIPINRVKFIINEVEKYGRIRQIWIGLGVQDLTPLIARSLDLESTSGVIVTNVDRGSPAERAGIKRGDVIVEVNGVKVRNLDNARKAIFGSKVGDSLSFTIIRGGKRIEVKLKVEEMPSR